MQHTSRIYVQAGYSDTRTWDLHFHKVAYSRHDVPWFVQQTDLANAPKGFTVIDGGHWIFRYENITMTSVS
jgi:hypothetical protein